MQQIEYKIDNINKYSYQALHCEYSYPHSNCVNEDIAG